MIEHNYYDMWDRKKLMKEMLEWSKKDDSINLCGFCDEYEIDPSTLYKIKEETDEFKSVYLLIKARIAARRERKVHAKKLDRQVYILHATTYDYFLREERRSEIAYAAELKAKEAQLVSDDDKAKLDALMTQLSSLQKLSSSTKTANMSECVTNVDERDEGISS